MSLAERTDTGSRLQREILGATADSAATLLDVSTRDFAFAEVWSRPGLDRRARYLVSIAGAAAAGDGKEAARYLHGALAAGILTAAELREAALHVAVYCGWAAGRIVDAGTSAAIVALGLAPTPAPASVAAAPDPPTRTADGTASFAHNMLSPAPPPTSAYFHAGILDFVFGEMWNRPGLDQRSRRWLTLVGVSNSSCPIPISSHVWSAMASGNATADEMLEFVLHYALHGGWPRASVVQGYVLKQAARVADGLPFEP